MYDNHQENTRYNFPIFQMHNNAQAGNKKNIACKIPNIHARLHLFLA